MTSVNDLFRKPGAQVVSKRKLEDPTTSFSRSSNKSSKLSNGSSPRSSASNISGTHLKPPPSRPAPSVEDEIEQQDAPQNEEDDDVEAGPAPPPDDDDEEVAGGPEDEEGRFFGSGVTAQEKQVMTYLDQNDDDEPEEKIDLPWLKRIMISFERKINKNAELRAKFENEPMKFVASEADLDTDIRGLALLSGHGELYPEFAKHGGVASLVSLLAHENTDIAIAVCQVLEEFTDEDATATEDQRTALVDAMLENDLIDLLVSNLLRLDEANESDRDGVYHILSVIENLLSQPENLNVIGAKDQLLMYLTARIDKADPDARGKVGQNRQYAAELLAILLQGSTKNRDRFASSDGVDTVLRILSGYRKRDPEKDSDEEEFVENLFDVLTCLVNETISADKFLEAEGVELCLIMLREGKLSKARALKVLDHGMNGAAAVAICDKVVDANGLKTLFGLLMKTENKGKVERESVEHLIGIMAGLLRHTPANSAARIRTLAKFVEKDYEKIGRVVELRKEYVARLDKVDREITSDRARQNGRVDEELEDEFLSRRLDAGLFSLQSLDVILSWLAAEDEGARKQVLEFLGDSGATLTKSLQEQIAAIDEENTRGRDTKEMLQALLAAI
jgi:beta-catenin-like protein 1